MVLVTCPTCKSDLCEMNKRGNVECISCGDEFSSVCGVLKEIGMSEIVKRLEDIRIVKEFKKIQGVRT